MLARGIDPVVALVPTGVIRREVGMWGLVLVPPELLLGWHVGGPYIRRLTFSIVQAD